MLTVEPHYLKKSIRIFRIYGIAFLISIFTMSFLESLNQNFKAIYDALIVLPFFIRLGSATIIA